MKKLILLILGLCMSRIDAMVTPSAIHIDAPLKQYLDSGDHAKIREYFAQGKNSDKINMALDSDENTLLHHAAMISMEDDTLVEFLHKHGADLNKRNKSGNTPLHTASVCKNEGIIKQLIACGANVNLGNMQNRTPLFIACITNNIRLAQCLMVPRINPNIGDIKGNTPLHIACTLGNMSIVRLLITPPQGYTDHSISIAQKSKLGHSALFYACLKGHYQLAQLLIDCGIDIQSEEHNLNGTVLHAAVASGSLPLVRFIVEKGANINARKQDGATPVWFATEADQTTIVEYLIKEGADISLATHEDGLTPLHLAAAKGNEYLVDLLATSQKVPIDVRASISEGIQDLTPLHLAILRRQKDSMIRLLLKHGASIDARAEHQLTPLALHFIGMQDAASPTHEKVLHTLLKAGADLQAKSDTGDTPLQFAKKAGSTVGIKVITDALSKAVPCNYCKKVALTKRCSSCSKAFYCTVGCQKADWATHKVTCKKVSSLTSSKTSEDKSGSPQEKESPLKQIFTAITNSMTSHVSSDSSSSKHEAVNGCQSRPVTSDGQTKHHESVKTDDLQEAACEEDDLEEPNPFDLNEDEFFELPASAKAKLLCVTLDQGHFDCAKTLVDQWIKSSKEHSGIKITALHYAAGIDSLPFVRYLVGIGEKIDAQTIHGKTPLMFAIEEGYEDIVAFLLEQGASLSTSYLDHATMKKYTPLEVACHKGNEGIVQLILKRSQVYQSLLERALSRSTDIRQLAKAVKNV